VLVFIAAISWIRPDVSGSRFAFLLAPALVMFASVGLCQAKQAWANARRSFEDLPIANGVYYLVSRIAIGGLAFSAAHWLSVDFIEPNTDNISIVTGLTYDPIQNLLAEYPKLTDGNTPVAGLLVSYALALSDADNPTHTFAAFSGGVEFDRLHEFALQNPNGIFILEERFRRRGLEPVDFLLPHPDQRAPVAVTESLHGNSVTSTLCFRYDRHVYGYLAYYWSLDISACNNSGTLLVLNEAKTFVPHKDFAPS
jgi:hypothetical protein